MRKTLPTFLRSASVALTCALPLAAPAVLLAPLAATAQTSLPAPYVSKALDALLLPIDDSVRDTFGLSAADTGVFLLATAPDGLAELAGLAPGDVLDFVRGEEILSPADLDAIVWAWIEQGVSEFVFDGRRAGAPLATETVITLEIWESWVEFTEISTWSSYSSESFSYEVYTDEYSEENSASYSEESYSEEVLEEEMMADDTGMEDPAEEDLVYEEPAEEEYIDDGGGEETYEE
jgi:hypothetical protein